ncbi:MAG TPA: AI-2E family transporter [Polyangia bacterium]
MAAPDTAPGRAYISPPIVTARPCGRLGLVRTEIKARGLLAAASLVVVFAGLRAAAPWLLPFILGLLAAILAQPLLTWLKAKRVPAVLAVVLTTLTGLVLVAVVVVAVERSLAAFISAAPRYQQRLQELGASTTRWLESHHVKAAGEALKHVADPSVFMPLVQETASAVATLLEKGLVVFAITIFALVEAEQIESKIRRLAPDESFSQRFTHIVRQVQRYLGLKTLIGLSSAVLTSLWAALLGVDFVPLWGLLSFVLGFIPSVGLLLATIPPVLVALLQLGLGRAIATLAGYVVIQTIIGQMIEPRLMGRSFGLSPLAVFLALLFWGWLWGPVGMFLSVPLTMVLVIVCDNLPDLRWLARLLGSTPDREPP